MARPQRVVSVAQPSSDEVARLAPELVRLQRSAYALEAALIGDDRVPQLTETADQLREADLVWHTVRIGDEVVAAVAYSVEVDLIDIDRLVVAPHWHRQGLARRLIGSLPAGRAVVSTGRDNTPARRLYESLDFAHAGDHEVLPGLWVSTYRRA